MWWPPCNTVRLCDLLTSYHRPAHGVKHWEPRRAAPDLSLLVSQHRRHLHGEYLASGALTTLNKVSTGLGVLKHVDSSTDWSPVATGTVNFTV